MNLVIIGVGSNIDPQSNTQKAFDILQQRFRVLKIVGPIITSPLGITDQDDFCNATVMLETSLSYNELVSALKKIEDEMGRDRSQPKYGPREIDLDVILWNNNVMNSDYYERDFLQKLVALTQG
jgi:2-amino-4-hydroxy-6-hydroxymethyldihydropteridine diphosphokinase